MYSKICLCSMQCAQCALCSCDWWWCVWLCICLLLATAVPIRRDLPCRYGDWSRRSHHHTSSSEWCSACGDRRQRHPSREPIHPPLRTALPYSASFDIPYCILHPLSHSIFFASHCFIFLIHKICLFSTHFSATTILQNHFEYRLID